MTACVCADARASVPAARELVPGRGQAMRVASRVVLVAALCAAVVLSLEARAPGAEAEVHF